MTGLNPYNCSKPNNLFVGYKKRRREILNGFRNGNSYAIVGGRRCGKTSFLIQIEKDLQADGLAPLTPLPRFLDIHSLGPLTPALLFETLYSLVVQGVDAPSWTSGESGREYQHFLAHLKEAKPILDRSYGHDWVVIFLIDELDAAISSLPNDQFFQNLRNFLMISDFHRQFRLVASGVKQMANLISSGSPLNNLRNQYLCVLKSKRARELIAFGFPDGLDTDVESLLFQLTGKHPYLLQGLLEKLWAKRKRDEQETLQEAAKEWPQEHYDFSRWLEDFGPADHAVYQLLSASQHSSLHRRDIRHGLDPSLKPYLSGAQTMLSYHGLIDDRDLDQPEIAGTLFQDWYRENNPQPATTQQTQQADPQPTPTIRLFYSYSHKDEEFREELETHLSLLRRQGIIQEWHDRQIGAGQEWADAIDENLEAANVVLLLISADFLASHYSYDKEMKRALEKHEAGEACVIPIIVRPVDWAGASFGKLQALPKNAKAVTSWSNRDEAWVDVARGIRKAVEELRQIQ